MHYQQTASAVLEQLVHPPPQVRKQLPVEEYSKKKDKLKSLLQKSLNGERMLTEDETPQYDTIDLRLAIDPPGPLPPREGEVCTV